MRVKRQVTHVLCNTRIDYPEPLTELQTGHRSTPPENNGTTPCLGVSKGSEITEPHGVSGFPRETKSRNHTVFQGFPRVHQDHFWIKKLGVVAFPEVKNFPGAPEASPTMSEPHRVSGFAADPKSRNHTMFGGFRKSFLVSKCWSLSVFRSFLGASESHF